MASRMQNHGGCTEGWVVDQHCGDSFNECAVQERHPSQQRGGNMNMFHFEMKSAGFKPGF